MSLVPEEGQRVIVTTSCESYYDLRLMLSRTVFSGQRGTIKHVGEWGVLVSDLNIVWVRFDVGLAGYVDLDCLASLNVLDLIAEQL